MEVGHVSGEADRSGGHLTPQRFGTQTAGLGSDRAAAAQVLDHRVGQPIVCDEGRVDRVSRELLLHEAPPIDREKPLPMNA